MPISIGSATPTQFPAILSFWLESSAVPSSTDDLDGLEALCAHDPDALIVATENGAVVGTLIAAWDGWRGGFYRLAVSPSHRRAGIGRALVAHGEALLSGRGVRRISLIAVGRHAPAMGFWEAVGYQSDPGHVRFARNLG